MKNIIKLLSVTLLVTGATQASVITADIFNDLSIELIRKATRTTSGPITGRMFMEGCGYLPEGTRLNALNARVRIMDEGNLSNSFSALLLTDEFIKALGLTQAKALGLTQGQIEQGYVFEDAVIGLVRKATKITSGPITGHMFMEGCGYLPKGTKLNALNARASIIDEIVVLCDSFDALLLKGEFTRALELVEAHQIHPRIKFFNTYTSESSTEFFHNLLSTKQFDSAKRFAEAYGVRDADLSAAWLRMVTASEEEDERVKAGIAARLMEADEAERSLADLQITVARLEAELEKAKAAKDQLEKVLDRRVNRPPVPQHAAIRSQSPLRINRK